MKESESVREELEKGMIGSERERVRGKKREKESGFR